MGYIEILCQLCGVSFAIARHRRENEPQRAFWDHSGSPYVDAASIDESCGDDTGCEFESYETFGDETLGYQHVAGLDCASVSGYSGHRISIGEMKGCRAIQALMKKKQGWEPEDGDEDFEIEGEFFLTGVGHGSPDEPPLQKIRPARHRFQSIWIANVCCLSCFVSRADWDQVLT